MVNLSGRRTTHKTPAAVPLKHQQPRLRELPVRCREPLGWLTHFPAPLKTRA